MDKLKVSMDAKAAVRLSRIFPKMIKGENLEINALDLEKLGKLVQVAKEMREAQELFGRTRSDQALSNKKRKEATLDKLIGELLPLTEKETPKQGGLF